jgi:TonB family protein
MVVLTAVDILASNELIVRFNFYEGIRQREKTRPAVAATYYLKPLGKEGVVFDSGQGEEKARLKRVYGLKDVKSLLYVKWKWQQGETAKRIHEIFLSGNEYRVQLTLRNSKGVFDLEVNEAAREKSRKLLGTEMTLPQEQRGIFGFEDSLGKIYFLSFYREKNKTGTTGKPVAAAREPEPELLRRVEPEYPEEAVRKQLEGMVFLEVVVDEKGNVTAVRVTGGKHKILKEAAVKAVKQWKYRPYIKEGKAGAVKFTVVLDFYFY